MATQGPTPVDTGATAQVVVRPLDRTPAPLPPGPGTTGQIPTVTAPQGPPESAPPTVASGPGTGQSSRPTVTVTPAVIELPVEIPTPADQGNNVIPTVPNLIEVLADGTIIVQNASALNFTGSGVTATANGSTATLTITSGGTLNKIFNGTSYANIPTANGNVSIGVGGSIWDFDATGNLTLPYGAIIRDSVDTALAIGFEAGNVTNAQNGALAVGWLAGSEGQGYDAVAIGSSAGGSDGFQGESAIAIGGSAGANLQSPYAVAVGTTAGQFAQGASAVAIGTGAGLTSQGASAVAIGTGAGNTSQGTTAIAIGTGAGSTTQGANAVAIGTGAGSTSQANNSIILNATGANLNQTRANTFTVAPVRNDVANTANVMFYNATSKEITYGNVISVAGNITGGNLLTGGLISATGNITGGNISTGVITLTNSAVIKDTAGNAVAFGRGADAAGINAVAVGNAAGNYLQGNSAVAVGDRSGGYTQGISAVAVGQFAGNYLQGNSAVAIGNSAGLTGQGRAAVAIGAGAGATNQGNNSIILNATAANLEQTTANTFTVAPVRNDVANIGNVMFYNATSKEITYGNVVSVAGNITGGNIVTGGTILGNYTFSQSGNTSAYATKRILQYVPGTGAVTYSNDIDASSIYITGYAIEIHVSPSAPDDTGNGTIGTPVKTIARAQVLAAQAFETSSAGQRKTIILHPGDYAENVTIDTQYTVLTTHELVGKNTTLSGTLTITKGCTIDGLKMTNLVISADNTTGSVDIIGCTVTTATTKTSTAYTVFRGCDLSTSTVSITGSGSTVFVGGNYFTLAVNNAAAGVLAKSVVTMGPVTLTAGTLQLSDTLIYAAANTANAITQSAGSVITVNNCQTLIPSLTNVARNSFGGFYSILNAVYDKANSTFAGTSLNAILYSQYINADNISATGNITGGNLNAAGLSLSSNVVSALVSAANITTTANISGGNLIGTVVGNVTGTTVSVTGNITGGNLNAAGLSLSSNVVSAFNVTANIAGGNITTPGLISATGNITGGNIMGGANVNATTHTGTTVSVSANVTGGNLITSALTSTASLSVTGNTATITSANISIGYLNIPQISFAANATAALVDSGKHYYTTSASNLALTLADNSAVSWPVGTALSVVNRGTANVTVAPAAGVSLYLAGNSSSANRVVTTYGMATVMNVAANIWMISGTVV